MYKAIVTDLDGTLLNADHQLSAYTRDIIQAVSRQGVKLILASGRHYADLRYLRQSLDLDSFLISSNGARVHNHSDEALVKRNVDPDIVDRLLQWEIDADIHVNLFTDNDWLVEKPFEALLKYHKDSGFRYRLVDFATVSRHNVAKVFFIGKPAKLLELERQLEAMLAGQASLTYSSAHSLEVMAMGVSKGSALEAVLQHKNIGREATIAFGDGFNDSEMLQVAGKGILMGNAPDALKQKLGGYEVIGGNHQDAVAAYLEALFL